MNTKGLQALTTLEELKETSAIVGRDLHPVRLQYLNGSAQKGLRLWNVLQPNLPGYGESGGMNGYPTFSLHGLKAKGLL